MQESRRLFSKVKQKLHCEIVYFLNFKEKAQNLHQKKKSFVLREEI